MLFIHNYRAVSSNGGTKDEATAFVAPPGPISEEFTPSLGFVI